MCKTVLILFLTNYRTPSPLILDQNYINTKNQVIKAERRVLKELGFCVHVKHPHKVSYRMQKLHFVSIRALPKILTYVESSSEFSKAFFLGVDVCQ